MIVITIVVIVIAIELRISDSMLGFGQAAAHDKQAAKREAIPIVPQLGVRGLGFRGLGVYGLG